MNNSNQPLSAARLPRIFAAVAAATILLIVFEISTWVIQNTVEVWSIRIFRILVEFSLAAVLSFTILKKLVRQESERKSVEEQTRLAMEAARIGFWDWDVVKDKQVWSDTCKALLGLPRESEANFDVLMNRVHPDDREEMRSAMNRAIEEKRDYVCEYRVLWPDGSMRWQAARGRAFYDEMGRTIRMVGISMDIDSQKSTEARLHLQDAALEAAANSIFITDPGGTIVWVNRAFTELTGYAKEESIGQNPRMLKSWEHDQSFYKNLWSTIQSGLVWRGELRNRKKDGSLYTEEMTITPVRSPSGEITNFIAIKQDVTANRKMEAQYRQAQKMEAVGRLAGGVAHDFNNILGVITGYSEISLDKLESEHSVRKNLLQIKSAADRPHL